MDKCPRCGADMYGCGFYHCGSTDEGFDAQHPVEYVSNDCLRRQLAQRDSRIAELEAALRVERLLGDEARAYVKSVDEKLPGYVDGLRARIAELEAKLAAAARLAQDSAEAAGEAMEAVQSDASVIVIPGGDWTRLVELVSGWFPTHSCDDGDCQDCREDAEIKAIIARAEEANG